MDIKLTQYSHGAGCGCKIAPNQLSEILQTDQDGPYDPRLLVGNNTRDDAAVYQLDDQQVIISTTDFFMPIVDDPFDFGGIASVNAISDVYAMGGAPIVAISILGWPIDKLSSAVAREVLRGARDACSRAGIALAGGHSIDTPEPIFGLAVTGRAPKKQLKKNNTATPGCQLYLTKPIGIGILTTAQKRGILNPKDLQVAKEIMLQLNNIGADLGKLEAVKAMTDVTGFGLLGHLCEICEESHVSAELDFSRVPKIPDIDRYIEQKAFPGGTKRNFASYGHHIGPLTAEQRALLCDPQTSGGLLIALDPEGESAFRDICEDHALKLEPIGRTIHRKEPLIEVHP
jgi:selenide,water dikinase